MKSSYFVELLDLYGKDIPLQIFGAHKKKSIFGAIMGLISMCFIAAVTLYFLVTLFSRETKQIITNQDIKTVPLNDLSKVPILFGLTSNLGQVILPDPTIWDVTVVQFTNFFHPTIGVNYTILEVHPCTRADAGDFLVTDEELSILLCLPLGKLGKRLNSFFGDTTNGWNSIEIFLTKCDGNVNRNCRNRTSVDSVLEGAYFSVSTFVQIINHDNANSPSFWQLFTNAYQVYNSLYKHTKIQFTQNLYTDDAGFVFESLVTHNFYTLGAVTTEYSLAPPSNIPGIGTNIPITETWLNNSPYVIKTQRTFLKAQAVLANIGGIIKFIMVVAQLMTHFVNRRTVFIQIANAVFDYRSEGNKNMAESAIKINVAQKKEYNLIEIEGRTEKVVRISEDVARNRNVPTDLKINSSNPKIQK